jgi:uncharacterized phage infection (PIP) family protein YhgE
MKVTRVAEVLAVGGTLDSDESTEEDGPHASYGNPDFEDVQQSVDDMGDSVKDLHDSLEDSVTNLNDEVKDLTDDIEESLTGLHDEMEESITDLEESITDLHDELEDSLKDLHEDLEDEVDSLHDDLTEATKEIRAALADLHAATTYSAGQSPHATYTGSQPAPVPAPQTGMVTPTYYGGTATQPESNDNDDETAWKTVAIVSMVLTILLICGALICAVGYVGCMLRK